MNDSNNKTPEQVMEIMYDTAKIFLDDLKLKVWDRNHYEELKDGYLQGRVSWDMWEKYAKENNKPLVLLREKISNILDKRKLAEAIIQDQPLYYDRARNWWLWNHWEFKWERVDDTDILNAVDESALVNTINAKERTEILSALQQVSRANKPQDIKPTWIQFRNRIVDIITGEEYEATPKYFVTNPIPHPLHEERFTETPVMDKIFEEWVGKEDVKKLYEIMAYCLLPDMPIHRIFCFIGAGMNGKSKYLELLRRFVGRDNVCSTELDTLLQSRFEVTRLHKKLVCQMGETNFNEMSKTSTLKKLSGGDLIGFEYKGKDLFEDKNYAKILIATNNLPTTTDKTIGFYRRWMIIDFPNQFSEQKDILSEIPQEEYQSLCVKSVLLLKDLLTERKFTNEGSVEERMEKYESKSNFMEKFIKEYTEQDINSQIIVSDFYKKFVAWCKENRHREMSEASVSILMKKLNYQNEKKYFNWLFDGKGGQLRCWIGIKWKE